MIDNETYISVVLDHFELPETWREQIEQTLDRLGTLRVTGVTSKWGDADYCAAFPNSPFCFETVEQWLAWVNQPAGRAN